MWLAAPAPRVCRAPKCSSRRTTPTSIRTNPPRLCCRSTRCASIETCPVSCRSVAAILAFAWSRALRRSPGSNAVTAATPTLRPPLRERGFWRLVSHLSLGHLSVTGGPEGAAALKEVLRLYDLRELCGDPRSDRVADRRHRRTRNRAGSGPCGRLLPRPRRYPRIRPARLAGRRALSARHGAGALPCAARDRQQLHPHPRRPARTLRHRRRLAGPQRHPRARVMRGTLSPWGHPLARGRRPLGLLPRTTQMRRRSALGALGAEPRRFRFDAAVRVLTRAPTGAGPCRCRAVSCAGGTDLSVGRYHRGPSAERCPARGDGRADGPDRSVRGIAALLLGSRHPDAAHAIDGAAGFPGSAGAPLRGVLCAGGIKYRPARAAEIRGACGWHRTR